MQADDAGDEPREDASMEHDASVPADGGGAADGDTGSEVEDAGSYLEDAGSDLEDAATDAAQEPEPCDDGLFCNGTERRVNGTCVGRAESPCDDGEACTMDSCSEELDRCEHVPEGECAACDGPVCTPSCAGVSCGDDGCGGSCGSCDEGFACTRDTGECVAATQPGSCSNPHTLTLGIGLQVVQGETVPGLDETTPLCNEASHAPEQVYTFTLDETLGVDFRASGYDTVLSLRANCAAAHDSELCSDDSSPPGEYGSRVAGLLEPGTYFLIVDGYDADAYGPYTLELRTAPNCVPACDGKSCGDDACGGSCGTCDGGMSCGPQYTCVSDLCTPNCDGKACGDDGCGGSCGECMDGELCVPATGLCAEFPTCDPSAPACFPACGEGEFCGSDCACHGAWDPLPDLIVREPATQTFHYEYIEAAEACDEARACLRGSGLRRVLRFPLEVVNQGRADLTLGVPSERPDRFTQLRCGGGYGVSPWAEYALLDAQGTLVQAHQRTACVEDGWQALLSPAFACDALYACDAQGLQAGWASLLAADQPCQWLDVTDVAPGAYELRITVNPQRLAAEVSFDNNVVRVPFEIEAP